MDPEAVLALCHEHARAEAAFDADGVLATLAPVPRYEFFPLARAVEGWTNIERFYRRQFPHFASHVVAYQLLGEWVNRHTAVQEYTIAVREEDRIATYRVVSLMPVDVEAGLLAGERLYCDQGFVQSLLGPLYGLLEPISDRP